MSAPPAARQIVATYPYTDEHGAYQVVRFEPKGFGQRRRGGNGEWIWNLNGVKPTLYRQPELIAEIAKGEAVFIVEGEADVDRLRAERPGVTCNSGGAGKWPSDPALNGLFQGADVIIIPDRDEPGERHAMDVARKLAPFAKSIRLVRLPAPDISFHAAKGSPPVL